MGKHFWSSLLSIGSDILSVITANPGIAVLGNAAGGGISGGLKGALLGGGSTFLGSQILGPVLGKIGNFAGGGSFFDTAPSFGSSLGAGIGSLAGPALAGSVVEPTLAKAIGLGPHGTPSIPKAVGTSPSMGSPTASAGPGPAGPGLGISAATAPQIAPWYTPPAGSP